MFKIIRGNIYSENLSNVNWSILLRSIFDKLITYYYEQANLLTSLDHRYL